MKLIISYPSFIGKVKKEIKMEIYRNLGGNSNVEAYEIGSNFIKVQFRTGAVYLYTYQSAGQANIEQMKQLAINGIGLNSFIQRVVRKLYSARLI